VGARPDLLAGEVRPMPPPASASHPMAGSREGWGAREKDPRHLFLGDAPSPPFAHAEALAGPGGTGVECRGSRERGGETRGGGRERERERERER
jgi:hypothetical protein